MMPWPRSRAMAGPDTADPYSRAPSARRARSHAAGRADRRAASAASACSSATASRRALTRPRLRAVASSRAAIVEIDIEPFYETARLLYEGPWVAERYLAARSLIASAPEAMHPVTREIILGGARPDRGRCLRGVLQARRAAPRARPCLPADRRAAAADHADRLHGRAGAGRSDPAQQPARHLHQFRQSARSLRACGAGRACARTARRSA